MHLYPVQCFEHLAGDKAVREFSVTYLMLCLCAPERLENNKTKKDSDSGSSLDGSFCGNAIPSLCISSIG